MRVHLLLAPFLFCTLHLREKQDQEITRNMTQFEATMVKFIVVDDDWDCLFVLFANSGLKQVIVEVSRYVGWIFKGKMGEGTTPWLALKEEKVQSTPV